ncbi:MAG: acylphosphatase [Planctomycetes bacterium]|nr:acylphosphatase [Planctomycetota bacterium]
MPGKDGGRGRATGPARAVFVVSGVVQGVGYRYWACDAAERLGLAGWVRNRADGKVEGVAEGPREALEDLLERLWRGPSFAEVRDVKATWEPAVGDLRGFEIRR